MKIEYRCSYTAYLTIVLLLFAVVSFSMRPVSADEINFGLYPPNSRPFGTSFVDWTAKWWKWFISIPNSQHPFVDLTGERCGAGQEGPVWFLVGAAGHSERNCVIPSDKAILFPILNTECSYSESPTLKTEQQLRECAVDANKNAVLSAIVDNHDIKDIDRYRVTSGIFNVTYPSDSIFPTNSNISQAVSDGWFIMLEPLKPGMHEIKFSESQTGGETTAAPSSLIDVTYHVTSK